MGALYIKDRETADLVRRLAERSGVTNTALIRELARAREAELDRGERRLSAREKLERFWREHPLPPPTGLKADKAYYDELSGTCDPFSRRVCGRCDDRKEPDAWELADRLDEAERLLWSPIVRWGGGCAGSATGVRFTVSRER